MIVRKKSPVVQICFYATKKRHPHFGIHLNSQRLKNQGRAERKTYTSCFDDVLALGSRSRDDLGFRTTYIDIVSGDAWAKLIDMKQS